MSDRRTGSAVARLRTVSLRRRVVLFSLAVLGVVLVLVSALVLLFTGIESRSDLVVQLNSRAALADQLARQRLPPATIVERVRGPAVRVELIGRNGTSYDSGGFRPDPSGPVRVYPDSPDPGGPPGPPGRRGQGGPVLHRTLADGSQLTLYGDAGELTAIQRRLSRLLVVLGLAGLAVAGLALLATTRLALGPLDTMTALARSIAAGDRGRRLAPTRTDTELGRTASAFDAMLDSLEGAERQAKQSEAVARSSERKTRQFVADAAHELRTPIAGVRAAAEAALSSRATGEERDRLHLLLLREAGRAGRLVEDLLAMAQIDAGLRLIRDAVELRGLAEAEVERIRLLAPTVSVRVVGEQLTVPGDAQRLAQVLANLLDNARRYTPDGGEITVTVDHAPADAVPEAAELTAAELTGTEPTGTEPTGTAPTGTEPAETGRAGTEPAAANQPGKRGAPGGGGGESMARVRVADSGPGVPAEDRERIFDRLVRLDDARSHDSGVPGRSGVGLGLAIARGIARAHGGELRCDRDSVFELILPTSGTPVGHTAIGHTAVGDTAVGLPLPSTNHSADPGQLPVSSG
ncbi:MAG: two-component system, OmpR family, sensor kinase [Pseudonocardiales bacterium]|nr:two-component system, OmpR family, sensor kinase [Pseudonocardiales bacterium]